MVATNIEELEIKFQNVQNEVKKLKDHVDDSRNHVENVLKCDIDCVGLCGKNEQYSLKNNLPVICLEEEDRAILEEKFITVFHGHLEEDITSEEIDIIHRIGPKKGDRAGHQGS